MIWPFNKNSVKSTRQLAVQLSENQLHAVYTGNDDQLAGENLTAENGQLDTQQLQAFVAKNDLAGAQTTVLIGLADYQMLLVEAPPVEAAELAEALKWKVKDLLTQSVEQSLVDGFVLPEDAFRGRQKMAYAVATQREKVQALVDCLESVGLQIETVSIGELSLLSQFEGLDEHPALLLVIGESGGFMSMVANQSIYLVRQLDADQQDLLAEDKRAQALERLVLEIQRSRDYFESQMGKGVINRLLLLPSNKEMPGLSDELKGQLGLPIEMLTIESTESVKSTEQLLLSASLHAA